MYIECSIVEYNIESPTLSDYMNYMKLNNFNYDICEVHKITGLLVQIDILFIRKDIFLDLHQKENIVLGI